MIYEVFGRSDHDSPLCHLGNVAARSPKAAQSISWQTYDGFRGVDMWLVPKDAIIPVDASSGAMDEGVLEADASTLTGDPTDRKELE